MKKKTHFDLFAGRVLNSFLFLCIPILVSILVFAGCAHIRKGAATALLPVDQEIELGKQLSEEMEKELKLHPNPSVQNYITSLGERVLRGAAPDRNKSMSFTFKVVDDPETVNAFALPGGWIYIYSGLLSSAKTEAEVASVLAHEVAHVTKRHIAERLATAYGLQVLTAVALGQDPSTVKQMVSSVIGTGYLLKFSREQETDADLTGVKYLVSSGWNPNGFIDFFKRIGGEHEAGSRRVLGWISTHPMPEDRIVQVSKAIASYSKVPSFDGKQEYQSFLNTLGAGGTIQTPATDSTSTQEAPRSERKSPPPQRR